MSKLLPAKKVSQNTRTGDPF